VPAKPTVQRVVGRGERVQPGIWRLRLPLPWPGVPHCNAWAIAAGDGIVLVDTGVFEPGSMGHLERALAQVGLSIDLIRLIVCTHAHTDHCGQAAPLAERTGSEVWMHPDSAHFFRQTSDYAEALARRVEIARQSGVPAEPLQRWVEGPAGRGPLVSPMPLTISRDLVPGVEVETDLGSWQVIHTPGHAPSHVCLHQPERRLLISGDHLLGRVSLHFEYGWSPDSVGDFLQSLDKIEPLDARLALSGHGRPFTDIPGHIAANRDLVALRLDQLRAALREGAGSAYVLGPRVYGELWTPQTTAWFLSEELALLVHLETLGEVQRTEAEDHETWSLA
jgi:glyoxylase-like metal-dependent hydrolase (beta-lactamase superfamily II)